MTLEQQIERNIMPIPMAGCWVWMGACDTHGYGQIRISEGGRVKRALVHRLLFSRLHGSVPDGLELDHLCRVRCCVNPDHLEPVTHAVNIARGRTGKHFSERTHCSAGHLYDEKNTAWEAGKINVRRCRACAREKSRRQRARLAMAGASA